MKNILIVIALATGISGLLVSVLKNDNKLVFIEMGKVYEEFALTKELSKEMGRLQNARKPILDSLQNDFRTKTETLKAQPNKTMADIQNLARLEQEFLYKKELFDKDNQRLSSEYTTKIWNQLNQYIQDYGESKKFTVILGANGQGNIMYGEQSHNITNEVVTYVNARYNDKVRK